MSGRPFLVVGAGGHAKVVITALLRAGHVVRGACDPRLAGQIVLGLPVLGGDEIIEASDPNSVWLANGIGGENAAFRARIFARFLAAGFSFPAIVDPTAIIGPEVEVGPGAQIIAGAVVQACTRIGAGTVVNTGSRIDHDCRLGEGVDIGPGAILCGGVTVEDKARLGAGAVILPGRRVGASAVVAAGAVVNRDVSGGETVMGVPAKARKT